MDRPEFKTEVFEGPLDALLFLISKHKLNIHDISISALLEQYLEYIEQLKLDNLEVSSEFLAMAAHLVYIKTVSLLPKHEKAEELKKELEGRLLELQACKDVASKLAARYIGDSLFVRQPTPIEVDKQYDNQHDAILLVEGYLTALGKAKRNLPPKQSVFSSIVTKRMVSVTSKIIFVLKKLYKEGHAPYNDFFVGADRSELVATFLAVLELTKSKRITMSEDNQTIYFNKTPRHKEVRDGV